jgi:hypothetical protein
VLWWAVELSADSGVAWTCVQRVGEILDTLVACKWV